MYPLHFGHFAGVLSKAVWCALGWRMCFVILSGFRLWVKRRADDRQWRAFGRVVQVFGYGLPIAMLALGLRLLPVAAGGGRLLVDAGELPRRRGAAVLVALAVPEQERLAGLPAAARACLPGPAGAAAGDGRHGLGRGGARRGQHDVLTVDLLSSSRARGSGFTARGWRPAATADAGSGGVSVLATLGAVGVEPRRDRIPCGHRPEAAAGVPAAGGRRAAAGRRPGRWCCAGGAGAD